MINIRNLLPLYVIIFLGFFGYALTVALFIPMLADENFNLLPLNTSISFRATLSGFLLAAYPLGQFLGSPIMGKLSDYYGRKKVLTLSLFACLFGFSGIALSIEYHNLSLLFMNCFLTGLFESNMSISQSIIADNCKDSIKKNKLIGYAFSACSLGYIMGPLIGGLSAKLGYSAPFWITSFAIIPVVAWVFWGCKDISNRRLSGKINFLEAITAFKSIFTHRKLFKIYFINFLIFFSVQGLYRVSPLYVENEWKPSLQIFTILMAYVSTLCFLANLFIMGPLSKRFSTEKLLSALLLFGGISAIVIVIPDSFSWIWLTYGIAVMPTVMLLTVCTTLLSNQASIEEQGQVLGNNQALLVLGECLSASIGGLISAIMIQLPVVVMGLLLLLANFMFKKRSIYY